MKTASAKPFLFEIGVEELPSDAIELIRKDLSARIEKWLVEKGLAAQSVSKIKVEATPRRIVVFVKELLEKQPDRIEEISGPPVRSAYSENGEPTQVLLGFLKSKGAELKDVIKKQTPKGEIVTLSLARKGEPTKKLLKNFPEEIFSSFPFPKMMRWNSALRFPRPVRWLLALWGTEVLPCEYAGLRGDRKTYGHRFLAPAAISIQKADISLLEARLKKAHVTLSFENRVNLIREELLKTNPKDQIDAELIATSAALTEDPYFIQGSFNERFLRLPSKILATSMKKHQKIFVLYDKQGNVLPKFLAVLNGKKRDPKMIVRNYENVLDAKLKDAEFFYNEDGKTKLETKVESLKKVTFLGKLGTLHEKTERLTALVGRLGEMLSLSNESRNWSGRAAWLSKADLVTHMVYEFPDLQGYVGSEYAKREGEPEAVAQAIKDYYLPSSTQSADPLALSKIAKESVMRRLPGALLGIADKLDTLVGALGLGLEVKGSEDPYALRRAANGIVFTIFEFNKRGLFNISFSLRSLAERAVELYGDKIKLPREEVLGRFQSLIEERTLWILNTERARDRELLAGVFKASSENLLEVLEKFNFLKTLEAKEPAVFYQTYKILERTKNILKGAKDFKGPASIQADLLKTDEEKELWKAWETVQKDFGRLRGEKKYPELTRLYAGTIYDRIALFFDRVLVNDPDESIRRNRLALMSNINSLYTQAVADLSVLTQMEALK